MTHITLCVHAYGSERNVLLENWKYRSPKGLYLPAQNPTQTNLWNSVSYRLMAANQSSFQQTSPVSPS
jgi:hypothetical protein